MPNNLQKVRWVAWVTLLLAGGNQAWVFRHSVSPDGVAYLDLSDAVVSGRPSDLLNAYWSPLYPALLGFVRLLVSPTPLGTPYWEFALLHVVSFLGFVASSAAFEWFLIALDDESADWGDTHRPLASPVGRALAYVFFAVASLGMISLAGTVPDLLLAAAMFSAFACLLRLQRNPGDGRAAVLLGLSLGAGALAKAFAFPLSLVALITVALVIGRDRRKAPVLRAAAVFLVVTAPWILALSIHEGRLTVGRTGSLNYAWYVNGRQPPNTGVMPALAVDGTLPLKGVAVLDSARGTNPIWYDPARWHDDVRPRLSFQEQWARLSHSLRYYAYIGAPLLLAMAAIATGATRRDVMLTLRRSFIVLFPCIAALGAYALTYTLSRLIAPFVVAACLVVASAFPRSAPVHRRPFSIALALGLFVIHAASPPTVRSMVTITYAFALFLVPWLALREQPAPLRWLASLVAILAMWLLPVRSGTEAAAASAAIAFLTWLALRNDEMADGEAASVRRAFAAGAVVAFALPALTLGARAATSVLKAEDAHPEWTKAQRLLSDVTPAGSRIAVLGNPDDAGWARLARYQIVGAVPPDEVDAFQNLSDGDRARIMRAFSRVGATRLIAP